jgi:hypothetical protein
MAIEKNSSYKVDFTYKHDFPTLGERRYRADNLIKYSISWRIADNSFLRDIHESYIQEKKETDFWACIDLNQEISLQTNVSEVAKNTIEYLNQQTLEGKSLSERHIPYEIRFVDHLAKKAAVKTPEYKAAETAFSKWLKRREGVAAAWKVYAEEHNGRIQRNHWTAYNTQPLPLELDLKNYASTKQTKNFRAVLEKSRPHKFYHGMVVRLKEEYLDKRGKDPFYWNYNPETRKSERVGTIVDRNGELGNGSYGEGSRTVKVMWFATGEETAVMEKCLKLEEVSEIPAAATGET